MGKITSRSTGISENKLSTAVEALQAVSKGLDNNPAIDHLASALSFAGRAIRGFRSDGQIAGATYTCAAEANLQRTGEGDFPGMLKLSVTAIRLENFRDLLKEVNSLLLREDYAQAEQLLKSNLRQVDQIWESFERESSLSPLAMPKVTNAA